MRQGDIRKPLMSFEGETSVSGQAFLSQLRSLGLMLKRGILLEAFSIGIPGQKEWHCSQISKTRLYLKRRCGWN